MHGKLWGKQSSENSLLVKQITSSYTPLQKNDFIVIEEEHSVCVEYPRLVLKCSDEATEGILRQVATLLQNFSNDLMEDSPVSAVNHLYEAGLLVISMINL